MFGGVIVAERVCGYEDELAAAERRPGVGRRCARRCLLLLEQAKILFAEAEENNLGNKAFNESFRRWDTCSLCKQRYHGVVQCALGWACWKTYVGRPETDDARGNMAITFLGNGLSQAYHDEDALSVREAQLSTMRRIGASEVQKLIVQNNLANTYEMVGRLKQSLSMRRDVYSGYSRLYGEENNQTLSTANNLAGMLCSLKHFEEAKSLMRKTMPVARRVLGEGHDLMFTMSTVYAASLYEDSAATLDDLREAVTTLEDTARTARRVFGSDHPLVGEIEEDLRVSRAVLRARETPSSPGRS